MKALKQNVKNKNPNTDYKKISLAEASELELLYSQSGQTQIENNPQNSLHASSRALVSGRWPLCIYSLRFSVNRGMIGRPA